MRFSLIAICVAAVILAMVFDTEAWWFFRRRTRKFSCSQPTSRAKPYYFGTTSLFCMMKKGKKGKRGAPTRSTWRLKHRFIYFDGWYFEFGIGKQDLAVYNTKAVMSHRCHSSRESKPAGYSTLSVSCLKRCTDKYKSKYGNYRLLSHNCHHFANRMSNILCNYKRCPSWCN